MIIGNRYLTYQCVNEVDRYTVGSIKRCKFYFAVNLANVKTSTDLHSQ